jgi:hypothetical protein
LWSVGCLQRWNLKLKSGVENFGNLLPQNLQRI